MKLPINNRIIAKATIPNFEYFTEDNKLSDETVEEMIKDKLVVGFAHELLNKVNMDRIGAVGNNFETEYTIEAYVFTKRQLITFMQEIKDSINE
jgi:hypothetical protein